MAASANDATWEVISPSGTPGSAPGPTRTSDAQEYLAGFVGTEDALKVIEKLGASSMEDLKLVDKEIAEEAVSDLKLIPKKKALQALLDVCSPPPPPPASSRSASLFLCRSYHILLTYRSNFPLVSDHDTPMPVIY